MILPPLTETQQQYLTEWQEAHAKFIGLAERQRPKREAFERARIDKYAHLSTYSGPNLDHMQKELRAEYHQACREYFIAEKKAQRRDVFDML